MEDSLLIGDYLLCDKLTFGTQVPDRLPLLNVKLPSFRMPGFRSPQQGDIVIFESPEDPSRDMIKRCIAVAGQTVEIRDKMVYVGGQRFEEPSGVKYLDRRSWPARYGGRDNFRSYTVPPDCIFVMGDNRDNSYDSRAWGPVPLSKIKAHPLLIYFSMDSDVPVWNLPKRIRWGRLGDLVN
jgi:signal peptidase I